jgi:peptide/nickel transport system permease protein
VLTYIIRRLLYSSVVLVLASFLVFFFVTVSGDPLAGLRIAPNVSEITVKNVIERKHLDDPIPKRYLYWVQDAVTNQFGSTLLDNRPILPDLWRVMKNTMQLVLAAQLLVIIFAVLIGVYSAIRQYSPFDYITTGFSFLGLATPVFWLALMAQVVVVQVFERTGHRLFPIANLSDVNPGTGIAFWLDRAHHLVLPVLVLMVAGIAGYSRYMRAAMLEVVNSDYVRTARAKGLSERRVTMKHALRNALIPLVTVMAIDIGAVFAGAVITETVFNWAGMGRLFIDALRDYESNVLLAWMMVTGVFVILFNLVADLLYGVLDPRIRV